MAIVSASDYKTWKGISASTYDAQLAVVIPAAQSLAEKFCNRKFENATYTEKFSGTGWTQIVVSNAPITDIDFISVADASGAGFTLSSDDFTYSTDDSGIIGFSPAIEGTTAVGRLGPLDTIPWVNSPNFSPGFLNVSVGYDGGYTSQDMPASLKFAMYSLIDVMLGSAIQQPGMMNFKSEDLGNYSYANWSAQDRKAFMELNFGIWRRGIP